MKILQAKKEHVALLMKAESTAMKSKTTAKHGFETINMHVVL